MKLDAESQVDRVQPRAAEEKYRTRKGCISLLKLLALSSNEGKTDQCVRDMLRFIFRVENELLKAGGCGGKPESLL